MKRLNELFNNVDSDLSILSLSTDSRKENTNGIFFCIKGISSDGHKFIDNAIINGAKVIVHSDDVEKKQGIIYIKVKDTLDELNRVTNVFFDYPYRNMEIYAVTGTNGKTTTAYIIENILSNFQKCAYNGTIGTKIDGVLSQSNHMTTPDNIALTQIAYEAKNASCTAMALEISSHALEQKRADNVQVDVAIFTNLTHEHLDYHKTMHSYMLAKRKLFENLNYDSVAVLNIDDEYCEDIKDGCKCKIITYGMSDNADFTISDINLHNNGTSFTLKTDTKSYFVETNLLSKINTYNLTAALVALSSMGYSLDKLLQYTNNLDINIGRFQKIPYDDLNIYVDFAHTPDGFSKIFEFAKGTTSAENNIICVFGSAGQRDTEKRPILGAIADEYCDKIIICEDDYRDEDPMKISNEILSGIKNKDKATIIIDRYDAIKFAIENSKKNDTILILSKGLDRSIPKNGKDEYWIGDDEACKKILNI